MRAARGPCSALAVLSLALSGCWREHRDVRQPPTSGDRHTSLRLTHLQPGAPLPTPAVTGAYEDNAYGISQGQRLYGWFNCNGCHGQGGGGSGPALMDEYWIYGSEPSQVFATIAQGRPNGMPSFGGHLTQDQIWQLVAYVRSLAQLQRADSMAPRTDGLARQSVDQPGSAGGKTR